MIKKIGGFLEEHIEKIILIIVGLLCAWLLISRVLLTPNAVEYDNKKYSPGYLDEQILLDVKDALKAPPTAPELIPPDNRDFNLLFAKPLGDVDFDFHPKPEKVETILTDLYPVPDINKIKIANVEVEYIRSVAYEPVDEVTKDDPYQNSDCEPNDLDFVTVSGIIDIKSIVDEFNKCYNSGELADPCKAKPIFAQVNLQRQRLLSDGQWSEWENVSRTKIDYNKNLFKYVDRYSDLPLGGIQIYKYQLNHMVTQLELLQPEPYQFATANEEWFPPGLYQDFKKAQAKDERDAKKKEDANTSTTSTTSDSGGRRRDRNNTGVSGSTSTNTGIRRGSSRRSGGSTDYNTNNNNTSRRGSRGSTTQTNATYDTTSEETLFVNQVYDDYESIILPYAEDLTKRSEPILFWAHDDTVQPKNTYRYQVRVGLLNPTAERENDKLIFWTSFSDITENVVIQGEMYFFAGEVQEAAKTVSVSVYKLHLGYWYKKIFDRVAQGEMIGSVAEIESKEPKSTTTTGRITDTKDEKELITVDFTTGAIMMDIERVSEWTGGSSISSVPYNNMLYTYDGKEILKMPATRTPNADIWPPDLLDAYRFVQIRINDKYEEFKPMGSGEIDIEQVRSGQFNDRTNRY